MTERPCRKCGAVYPATTEYFYNTQGHYLSHKCKACANAVTVERNRERRRVKREGRSLVPKQTPPHIIGTPEYAEYRRKIRVLDQRRTAAKQRGAVESERRVKQQMDALRASWYQNLAVRGGVNDAEQQTVTQLARL